MEDSVDSLQYFFGFGVDSIVRFVVEFEGSAFENVFGLSDVGQRQLLQSRKVHLFDHGPSVLHLNRCISMFDLNLRDPSIYIVGLEAKMKLGKDAVPARKKNRSNPSFLDATSIYM